MPSWRSFPPAPATISLAAKWVGASRWKRGPTFLIAHLQTRRDNAARSEAHERFGWSMFSTASAMDITTPFICLNASTMGIGGETAARVAAQGNFMRRFSGEARFAAAALAALAGWRERRVRVSIDDDEVIEGKMNLVGGRQRALRGRRHDAFARGENRRWKTGCRYCVWPESRECGARARAHP